MRVLDLFAGLGGWGAPFRERGHEVVSLDIEERFHPTICADLLQVGDNIGEGFDVILASPPCETFSVLTMGFHWLPGRVPKTKKAELGIELVQKTVRIIEAAQPDFFVIENPVGMLRTLQLIPYERATVTYCQYGGAFRKPTDLWGGFPPSLGFRTMCGNGARCHVPAPRGSRTGTQGSQTAAERAKIPYELALDVCRAAEWDQNAGRRRLEFTGAFWGFGAD